MTRDARCAEPAGQHAGRVAGHAAPDQLDDRGRMCRIGYQPPAVRLGPDRNPAGRHGTAGQRPCLLQGVPGFARRSVLSASCDPDYAAVAAGLVRRCVADDSSGMPSRWLSAAGIPRHVNTVSPVPEAHRGLVIRVVMLG